MKKKTKVSGQILVIVLLVILMLSIITMSIVAVVNRDLEQSYSSAQYEESYNRTETKMFELLEDYADVDTDLAPLDSECGASIGGVYTCEYTDNEIFTQVQVVDTNLVEDFELGKDETFKMILNNYRGEINMNWTGEAAMLFTLEYVDGQGTYHNIKDVYDGAGVYSGSISSHQLQFLPLVLPQNSVKVDLSTLIGLDPGESLLYLKVRPIMKNGVSTMLSLEGTSAGFPDQVRKFEGITYVDTNIAKTAAPTLVSQLPLAGMQPEILNYVLRTDGSVSK